MSEVTVIKADLERNSRRNGNIAGQIRVAPYCRVSTDSEEQLTSYKSQVLHYRQLVEANPEWQLVEMYADEGISGTQTTKRIAFQKMINDAIDGKIDLIITKSISRFARNTLDTLKYVRLLKENNVAIFFEKENINTLTMNGEMLLVILSSLAQQESESISANVKMGLKMKMKRGEMIGFGGCLGYDYNSEDKTLSLNEEEAETVRYIFSRYVEGAGCFIIAKELMRMEAKTKRGNLKWTDNGVMGIVKNEKYKGDLLMGKTFTVDPISHRRLENRGEEEKYYVTNHHEPIVSVDTFEEAQLLLKKRSSKHSNKGRGQQYSRKYAFSSISKCVFCGGTAIRRRWHSGTNHASFNWQCGNSIKNGRKACSGSKGIRETFIEESFVEAFNRMNSDNRDMIDEFLTSVEETLNVDNYRIDLEKTKKEISNYENKGKKLVEMRISDKIDESNYEEKYDELTLKLGELNNQKLDLLLQLEEESTLDRRIRAFRGIFNEDEPLEAFDRVIFDSLVENVIMGETDEDGNQNPYVITFVLKTGLSFKSNLKKDDPNENEPDNGGEESSTSGDLAKPFSLSTHDVESRCSISYIVPH